VRYDEVDIAVDPLEGTNLCATGAADAIAVLRRPAGADCCMRPICTMEKLVVGPSSKDKVSLDAPVTKSRRSRRLPAAPRRGPCGRRARAERHEADPTDIRDRRAHPADRRRRSVGRHRRCGGRLRRARGDGHRRRARRRLDGRGDALPERRDFRAPFVNKPEHEEAAARWGSRLQEGLSLEGSRAGNDIIFAATGVTDGTLIARRRFFRRRARTSSVIMQNHPAPHPVHRQHSVAGHQRQDPVLKDVGTVTALASRTWRRNVFAVTAASFMGYTGFTLVMPFLPLFIGQLGVSDVGEIAMWTGISLGITPALTTIWPRCGAGWRIASGARSWSSARWSASWCCSRRWRS
jgi:hypothetical protein